VLAVIPLRRRPLVGELIGLGRPEAIGSIQPGLVRLKRIQGCSPPADAVNQRGAALTGYASACRGRLLGGILRQQASGVDPPA
jgi:hypothetical protein